MKAKRLPLAPALLLNSRQRESCSSHEFYLKHETPVSCLTWLSHVQLFATPWTVPTRLLRPWDFPGKSTGVGCHFLLQQIFLTQGSNPSLLHCSQILNCLSHQESYTGGERMRISLTLRSRKSSTKLKPHKLRGRY